MIRVCASDLGHTLVEDMVGCTVANVSAAQPAFLNSALTAGKELEWLLFEPASISARKQMRFL